MAELQAAHPLSKGSLIAFPLDLSDLESVSRFATWFSQHYGRLDFLVNNAGINYATLNVKASPAAPLCSPQGYDLTFASNFLGHFLLTEELMPLLGRAQPAGRVVQVSSNAQFMVTGEDLRPGSSSADSEPTPPPAARCQVNNDQHVKNAYGNSKLAQVLHSVALQHRANTSATLQGVKVGVYMCLGCVPSEAVCLRCTGSECVPRADSDRDGARQPCHASGAGCSHVPTRGGGIVITTRSAIPHRDGRS